MATSTLAKKNKSAKPMDIRMADIRMANIRAANIGIGGQSKFLKRIHVANGVICRKKESKKEFGRVLKRQEKPRQLSCSLTRAN